MAESAPSCTNRWIAVLNFSYRLEQVSVIDISRMLGPQRGSFPIASAKRGLQPQSESVVQYIPCDVFNDSSFVTLNKAIC